MIPLQFHEKRPLRVVFMGSPALACPTLLALLDCPEEFQVVGVVSQPDKPVGRGGRMTPPKVAALARERGLHLLQPRAVKGLKFLEDFTACSPDVGVVVAYGRILPGPILRVPKLGCVNVHASLLPAYRGAGPIQRALLDGLSVTGVTTMAMSEGLDEGPMLLRAELPIAEEDTAASLGTRLGQRGAELLVETLRRMRRPEGLLPEPQDEEKATFAPLLTKEDGRLDFALPAQTLAFRVRGTFPWPGAFTTLDGQGLKVLKARALPGNEPGRAPGTVLQAGDPGIDVACGEGVLRLLEVQKEGRTRLLAGDFARGHPGLPGTVLGLRETADGAILPAPSLGKELP